ncbi:protein translocase subunit secF [Stackebrandtia endophytica]|uniref:Protein-export membrane protein SecF n=1 Tax=Stackebrandtia endophytica TaxID=1496996 RepID=A0A543B3W9_9ACTN|nr:protein translocase subunit SecF [Stackebrandtia endophytica]TQL79531.1 protein translocase subunit secF [Stackebrandtia endophytica]
MKRLLDGWRTLYHGDNNYKMMDYRPRWYIFSASLAIISICGIAIVGFNLGIEFSGGSQFDAPVHSSVSVAEVRSAVEDAGVEVASAQEFADGARYLIRTEIVDDAKSAEIRELLATELNTTIDEVGVSEVSSSWGTSVSRQAVIALIVFLVAVSVYLWWRYEPKMAFTSIAGLLHNLVFTAGIYAIVGFEVTPGTVIGMLTILGYSLYDTVVVFDKVDENTKNLLSQSRYSFKDGANLAVNQTLMRSVNTSIIGLLPVAGLLFVGAGMMGVGTLKDLALVLFVGMLTGGFSSLFLSTPLLIDMRNREPAIRAHTRKVEAKQAANPSDEPIVIASDDDEDEDDEFEVTAEAEDDKVLSGTSSSPRSGARPAARKQQQRPGKKRKRR